MPRKSSHLSFNKLINKTFDNSMGDYFSLVFDFIDDQKLQYEFEKYLKKELKRLKG